MRRYNKFQKNKNYFSRNRKQEQQKATDASLHQRLNLPSYLIILSLDSYHSATLPKPPRSSVAVIPKALKMRL